MTIAPNPKIAAPQPVFARRRRRPMVHVVKRIGPAEAADWSRALGGDSFVFRADVISKATTQPG